MVILHTMKSSFNQAQLAELLFMKSFIGLDDTNKFEKFMSRISFHIQGCGLTFLKLKIPILVADLHNNRWHYLYSYMLKEIRGIRWQTVVQAVGGLGLDLSSPPFCALRPSLNQELNQ